MREEATAAVRTTVGEGVDRVVPAAPRDLTVREAILAAAELNSGVPAQRDRDTAGEPAAGPEGARGDG
ncbi:hypothetical protein SAMN04489730_1793 [Amycolatopsis australiensis]|uniref:Uncharacterized protein n=1 Tax=Amycolatopsis australiensis TaxID=546364 RepID=A0A1K1QGU2_9PSEU|nr:hypothetical protein SAMN04489730_1793 [Amycolatopsis australiensis]